MSEKRSFTDKASMFIVKERSIFVRNEHRQVIRYKSFMSTSISSCDLPPTL